MIDKLEDITIHMLYCLRESKYNIQKKKKQIMKFFVRDIKSLDTLYNDNDNEILNFENLNEKKNTNKNSNNRNKIVI